MTVNASELTALVLSLKSLNTASLPATHGAMAYAAALDMIGRFDPALTVRLHDTNARKPLTVSPLFGPVRRGREVPLTAGQAVRWRLCGLNAEISAALVQAAIAGSGVRIGDAVFEIDGATTAVEEDADAGNDTFSGLLQATTEAPVEITLSFITPTCFRQRNFELPFPLPRLLWGSLLDAWNAFSPELIDETRYSIEDALYITNYIAETCRADLGNRSAVGFVGKFSYRVVNNYLPLRLLLNLLARFAFYAGAGWQTTCGLGQVRPYFR
ncbi:MAG TPA: CRISPR-associated endoribonuclease Cas6 [Methylomusa anaerophila]|uniref:CRISPR-associated protein Cas6 C-terminal domain-containing protein n=1 Tax=Methylomusa anaerophila TaxID=1930071 RepID=A0A348ALW9_9FIRM|nr:CRISPR-associated endoribonuclease Cas6 [Methylomusa anaerophila]BBB92067.1 hypothetical protein MAMMFC1_02752 [Methylomusa anaerophila]HML87921.1 CRISPR-associated endoribonuclease Cas6 [Methylomusa anaerophila]